MFDPNKTSYFVEEKIEPVIPTNESVKPYKCLRPNCKASFNQRGNMLRHIAEVHMKGKNIGFNYQKADHTLKDYLERENNSVNFKSDQKLEMKNIFYFL